MVGLAHYRQRMILRGGSPLAHDWVCRGGCFVHRKGLETGRFGFGEVGNAVARHRRAVVDIRTVVRCVSDTLLCHKDE